MLNENVENGSKQSLSVFCNHLWETSTCFYMTPNKTNSCTSVFKIILMFYEQRQSHIILLYTLIQLNGVWMFSFATVLLWRQCVNTQMSTQSLDKELRAPLTREGWLMSVDSRLQTHCTSTNMMLKYMIIRAERLFFFKAAGQLTKKKKSTRTTRDWHPNRLTVGFIKEVVRW